MLNSTDFGTQKFFFVVSKIQISKKLTKLYIFQRKLHEIINIVHEKSCTKSSEVLRMNSDIVQK